MKQKPTEKKQEESLQLQNQLARVLADYDNLKKRVEKERETLFKFSLFGFLNRLFPIVDMLEEAQKHLGDQGLAIALGELHSLFKDEGVVKIKSAKGDIFDEKIHEAIEMVDDGEKGAIAESSICGYKYNDGTVLRYEKVKVFKGNEKSGKKEEKIEK